MRLKKLYFISAHTRARVLANHHKLCPRPTVTRRRTVVATWTLAVGMHCIFYSRIAVRSGGKRLWEIRDGSLTHRTVQVLSWCILHKCATRKMLSGGKDEKAKGFMKNETDYYMPGNVLIIGTIIDTSRLSVISTFFRWEWIKVIIKVERALNIFILQSQLSSLALWYYFLLFFSCHIIYWQNRTIYLPRFTAFSNPREFNTIISKFLPLLFGKIVLAGNRQDIRKYLKENI